MPYQSRVFELVVFEEELDILSKRCVSVLLVVGGVAVVAQIESVDWTLQVLRESPIGSVR